MSLKLQKVKNKFKKNVMVMSLVVFIILVANYDKSLGVIIIPSVGASFLGLSFLLRLAPLVEKKIIFIMGLGIVIVIIVTLDSINILSIMVSIVGVIGAYCKNSNKFLESVNA